MRLGVVDVGSNTVHLLVVDAHPGARPLPAFKQKTELRLAELIGSDGSLSDEGADLVVDAIRRASIAAEDLGVEDLIAFATSAVRDATNSEAVLARVRAEAGVDVQVLPGADEARLTFLAVRRWFGWSAGRLLVLDIGGGSLELAAGLDEEPDTALSLPLGAGRLTRAWLHTDPTDPEELRALRRYVRIELARSLRTVLVGGPPDRAVGSSKTFRSLGRIAGIAPYAEGPYAQRRLSQDGLRAAVDTLTRLDIAGRAELPGVSPGRAGQLLAGGIVALSAMELLELDSIDISPWALREGVILRRLDWLTD